MTSAPASPLKGGVKYVRRPAWLLPLLWIVGIAIVVILPFVGVGAQAERQIVLTVIMVLLVSGLNLTFGWSGELNMGIPAMYAAGAFTAGWVAIHLVNDVLVSALVGAAAALIVGVITGVPGLRLGGWVLSIVSFFIVLLIPFILQVIPEEVLGGTIGLIGIPLPQIFGIPLTPDGYYVVVILIAALWFAVYRNIVKSRVGDALVTMQHGEALAPSLGISRYRLKLLAYAVGAIPAGIAGALYASLDLFLGLETFGITLAVNVLAASIVSGRRSIYAILIGAAFVQFITARSSDFGQFGQLAFGLLLIAGGILFGGGIVGVGRALLNRVAPNRTRRVVSVVPAEAIAAAPAYEFPALEGKRLEVDDVRRVFGGAVALDGASFVAEPGRITALIGPNGSGKTTMLNVINGFYKPTAGAVRLGGETISTLSSTRVARQGVARTFQTPFIPADLRMVEVVATANIMAEKVSLLSTILRLPRYWRVRRRELSAAYAILRLLGLEEFADQPAQSLALGTRRMTELARALASRPSLILLDEVASGLDTNEVVELAKVLRVVSQAGATVVLVEHNFALVRSLADHVVVLADGKVLTSGRTEEIEKHPDVLKRFLGEMSGLSGTSMTEPSRGRENKEEVR